MGGERRKMLCDICAAVVLFVHLEEACVARCYVQEKGTNGRMVDEMF